MYKKAKVIMLPTYEKAQLVLGQQLANVGETDIPNDKDVTKQHLYITTENEIKKNDWYLNTVTNEILQAEHNINYEQNHCNKIIATTNILSDYKESTEIGLFLPQLSQLFIQKYVEEYNKGNIINNILVEYKNCYVGAIYDNEGFYDKKYENILKVNPKNNTINIKKVKNSWNREEVEYLCRLAFGKGVVTGKEGKIGLQNIENKWIEENL